MARTKNTNGVDLKPIYAAAHKAGFEDDEIGAVVMRYQNIDITLLTEDDVPDVIMMFEELAAAKKIGESQGVTTAPVSGDDEAAAEFRKEFIDRRYIEAPWTQDEVDEKTERLLEVIGLERSLAQEKKDYDAKMNDRLGTLREERFTLHEQLTRGTNRIETEVRVVRDFEAGVRKIYDTRTDKLIETEPLTAADHELEMDLKVQENAKREQAAAEPPKKAAAKKAPAKKRAPKKPDDEA